MKLALAAAILLGLAIACVAVPIGNRTVWGHAKDHGVPQAAGHAIAAGGHAVASGVGAAWTWLNSKGEPAHPQKTAARQTLTTAHLRAPQATRTLAPTPTLTQTQTSSPPPTRVQAPTPTLTQTPSPSPAPLATPDAPTKHGILEAPPAEKLSDSDKHALDRLVARAKR